QQHYLEDLLDRHDMSTVRPKHMPMDPLVKLYNYEGQSTKKDQKKYASILGGIGWAANCTRPDLAYAHSKLARYTANPGPEHWKQLQRLFGYIKATSSYALLYKREPSDMDIKAY